MLDERTSMHQQRPRDRLFAVCSVGEQGDSEGHADDVGCTFHVARFCRTGHSRFALQGPWGTRLPAKDGHTMQTKYVKVCLLVSSAVVRILKILLSIPEHSLLALVTPARWRSTPATNGAHVGSPVPVQGSHTPSVHLTRVWRAQSGLRILLHAKNSSSGFGVVLLAFLYSPESADMRSELQTIG